MHQLSVADLNPAVLNVQYAVRGELAIKAEDLRNRLDAGHDLPFKRVINSNIGNPQQKGLDQPPLTFMRQVRAARDPARNCIHAPSAAQVAALMEYPPLVELVKDKWPADVIERAQELQAEIGSIGAYSHSKGVPLIRKHVAKFIEGASPEY